MNARSLIKNMLFYGGVLAWGAAIVFGPSRKDRTFCRGLHRAAEDIARCDQHDAQVWTALALFAIGLAMMGIAKRMKDSDRSS